MSFLRVGTVVVTFEPDRSWPERLAAIAAEHLTLVVVDNSSSPATRRWVREVTLAQGGSYRENPDNPGIGRALNQGFETLAAAGMDWVIAFDQDSTPAPGLSATLLAATGDEAAGSIAAVGSNWTDVAAADRPSRHVTRSSSFPWCYRRREAAEDLVTVLCLINSGTLFSVRVWRELGGFDDSLILDLVDSDYCLRALKAGHGLRVAARARLAHARGRKREVKFLGRTFRPAFMPPFRLYYLYRNRMILFKKHRLRPLAWIGYECVYAGKVLADILFLEDDKWAKIRACFRGTLDGLRGRLAPPRQSD